MRNSLINGGLLVGVLTAVAWAQTAPIDELSVTSETYAISDEEFKVSISDELAAEVDELIAQLGSPKYATREATTRRLIDIGLPAFTKLRAAYRTTEELEARLRIERIVEDAYLASHIYNRNAFLGIRHQFVSVVHAEHPGVPEGHFGIKVVAVLPDTAADEAGIEENDVIIRLDGGPLSGTTGRPTTEFGESIRLRRPGTVVTLSILRGPVELEITATLRPRPKGYYVRAGQITQMLEEAKQRFQVWWYLHFREQAARMPGTSQP